MELLERWNFRPPINVAQLISEAIVRNAQMGSFRGSSGGRDPRGRTSGSHRSLRDGVARRG